MKKQRTEYDKNSWKLVGACLLAYFTVYIGRKNLSVCLADMILDGIITQTDGGRIGTAFLICYAGGQLINGWLGDKLHPQYMICGGLCMAGLMNVLMGLSQNSLTLTVVWAFCGYFCSMLWSPILRAVSCWTSDEIKPNAVTSLSAMIPAGAMASYFICAFGLKFFIWRTTFILCGAILILVSGIIFILFGTLKNHMTSENSQYVVSDKDKLNLSQNSSRFNGVKFISLGLIFTAAGILFNGILKDGLDLWIPTMLNSKFIPSPTTVSLICTFLPLLTISGAYIAKFIYKKYKLGELSVCGIMFVCSTILLAITTIIIKITPAKIVGEVIHTEDILLGAIVTIFLALSSSFMLGANTMLLTFIPMHYGRIGKAATVTGALDCFSYAAASVSSIAAGYVSENFGWEAMFVMFTVCSVIGGVVCFLGNRRLLKDIAKMEGKIA